MSIYIDKEYYIKPEPCKLTADELVLVGRLFPEMPRDRRTRVTVCDCDTAQSEAKIFVGFREVQVPAKADGTCPYCGHYARLVVA